MATSNLRTLTHDEYGVAIICPMEVEMSAMRYMLDEEHASLPKVQGDSNGYIYGQIKDHNIVIGYLPEGSQGVGAAAVVATNLKRSFPNANMRFLVGIGGGVPSSTRDIRLGDVVVSKPTEVHGGVVQYDLGKDTVRGFERKESLMVPPSGWRNRVVKLQSDHLVQDSQISALIDKMVGRYPGLGIYRYPAGTEDVLFLPDNGHVFKEPTCGKCNRDRVVDRLPRFNNAPAVFYGLIASGNRVVKNAGVRDQIAADAGGAFCFEMEAAGLMNDFPCIVIRGISDYADSHKNDDWHRYAAATAAGYTKELLLHVDPERDIPVSDRNQHWTIKQTVNPSFTGRTELVNEISDSVRKALQNTSSPEQRRIVLTGMGGLGKSEICLNVANKLRPLLWGVFWVDVDTKSIAENGFALIGNRLKLPTSTIDDVLQYLANAKQPWLLILDNADDADVDYQKYFPSGSTGIILLTSRNRECHIHATHPINPLDGLPLVDACTLLEKSLQPPTLRHRNALRAQPHSQDQISQEQLKSVAVALLNGHPLAIIQAGAYISQGHCSITQYPQVFERQRKRLLTFRVKQAQSRYGNVYATFEASAQILRLSTEEAAGDALQLLSVLSMFAPNNFPTSLFETAWNGVRKVQRSNAVKPDPYVSHNDVDLLDQWHLKHLLPLMDIDSREWDSFRLTEAIQMLETYSLTTVTGIGGSMTISMHPLAHAWAKDCQPPASLQKSWLQAGCTLAVAYPTILFKQIDQQLRPHLPALLAIESSILRQSGSRVMIARLLTQVGRVLQCLLLDRELLELWQMMFEWLNLDFKNMHDEWLPLYELAAVSLRREGKCRDAVTLLEQVVEKNDQTLSDHGIKRLESQRRLADAYHDNGQVQQAIELLQHVVRMEEQALEEDDHFLLRSQHQLAQVYHTNGQRQEAIELFEEIARKRQSVAEDNSDRLDSQHELARAYLDNGKVQKAVDLFEEVVRLRQSLAEDHPNRLASRHVLAKAYLDNGQLQQAVDLLEDINRIQLRTLAENHPDRLVSQHALGRAYHKNGQVQRAIDILDEVVRIQQTLAEDQLRRLDSQYELAAAYLDNGQVQRAIGLLEEIVRIRQSLAENHPQRLVSRHELARAYQMNGQAQRAVDILDEVVRIQQTLVENHPRRLASEQVLAVALWRLGQRDRAFQAMQELAEKKRRIYGEGHHERKLDESWLADMRQGLGLERPSAEHHSGEEDNEETSSNMQPNSKDTSAPSKPDERLGTDELEDSEGVPSPGAEEDLARRAESLHLE